MTGAEQQIYYDKQEQLEKVQESLLAGESVIAVYDGKGAGTGFIGLTDRRVVIQDNSFVGKRVALTSVPYNRIHAVSVISNTNVLGSFASSSAIAISTSSHTYEVDFRGVEKAKHAHDVILTFMG